MSTRQRVICICIIAVTCMALVGTIIAANITEQYDITVGSLSPVDFLAPRQITDTETTRQRKEAAGASVEKQYDIDFSATNTALTKLTERFSVLRNARTEAAELMSKDDGIIGSTRIPKNSIEELLSDANFKSLIKMSDKDFETLFEITNESISSIMSKGVTDEDVAIEEFKADLESYKLDEDTINIALQATESLITINKTYNDDRTQKLKTEAEDAVSDIVYQKNQIIARKGDAITLAQFKILKDLGKVKGEPNIDILHTISLSILLLVVVTLVLLYYILIGKNDITTSHTGATIICCILTLIGAFLVLFDVKFNTNFTYLLPLSMVPALISLLLNANISSMINILVAVLAGIQFNNFTTSIIIIIAGSATAYYFSRVRRRAHLLPATLLCAATYALTYAVTLLEEYSSNVIGLLIVAAYAFFGGFLGGILTIGTIPFWEAIFDVITPMKLGELSNPEHKLLKKLLLKAPGSYHHALTVANMADSAAYAINANSLLARVGAYYHDIGKIENPIYFKENQMGEENPHDDLPPEESASIIISHVSDGYALANQYRLPRVVRDIILQHHGTTTASYFLYKAKEKNPNVDTSIFSYEGPTPQSKEATIIMLADACEAAVRAMREKGFEDVSQIVDDIVASRIADGQLASSELTFADLVAVKASFVRTLEQYFHKRIVYPQNNKQLERK